MFHNGTDPNESTRFHYERAGDIPDGTPYWVDTSGTFSARSGEVLGNSQLVGGSRTAKGTDGPTVTAKAESGSAVLGSEVREIRRGRMPECAFGIENTKLVSAAGLTRRSRHHKVTSGRKACDTGSGGLIFGSGGGVQGLPSPPMTVNAWGAGFEQRPRSKADAIQAAPPTRALPYKEPVAGKR